VVEDFGRKGEKPDENKQKRPYHGKCTKSFQEKHHTIKDGVSKEPGKSAEKTSGGNNHAREAVDEGCTWGEDRGGGQKFG